MIVVAQSSDCGSHNQDENVSAVVDPIGMNTDCTLNDFGYGDFDDFDCGDFDDFDSGGFEAVSNQNDSSKNNMHRILGVDSIQYDFGQEVIIGNRHFYDIDFEEVIGTDCEITSLIYLNSLLLEFSYCSNNDCDFIDFATKKSMSHQDIERFSNILHGYNAPFDLSNIYDEVYDIILHKTPMAKLASSFRFCNHCKVLFYTTRIYCENCNKALIKKCSSCGLTESSIRNKTTTTTTCSCFNSTPNETYVQPALTPEGFITQLHASGVIDTCITEPSRLILHSEYEKENDGISSVVTLNTADILKSIGRKSESDHIKKNIMDRVPKDEKDLYNLLPKEGRDDVETLLYGVSRT